MVILELFTSKLPYDYLLDLSLVTDGPVKKGLYHLTEVDERAGARFDDGGTVTKKFNLICFKIMNQLDGFDARGNIKIIMATNINNLYLLNFDDILIL